MFCTCLSLLRLPMHLRLYVSKISPVSIQYPLLNFCQTFVIGASGDKNERIRCKGQGHIITAEASSTQRCHRVQLLVLICWTYCYFSELLIKVDCSTVINIKAL